MKAKFLNVKSLFDSKQHTLEFRDFKARAFTKEACYELLKEALEESFLKEGKVVTEEFRDLRDRKEPLAFGGEIASGERIEVELTLQADHNFEYMVFEDPKPAGCEPYRLRSGASYGGGTYANMELRDTKVAFFATYLSQGQSTLTYTLVCEQPGTFRILPAGGEAMYSPFVEAISDSGKLVIHPKAEN